MYFYLRNVSEFFICMYDSSFLPENCYGRTEVCSMTLKDIADLAGVSMMTVSNVINGKTSRVSQKTRDKVNAIIEEYGYVPNLNARSLSNKKSHFIGIIISLDEKDVLLGTNYFENP